MISLIVSRYLYTDWVQNEILWIISMRKFTVVSSDLQGKLPELCHKLLIRVHLKERGISATSLLFDTVDKMQGAT